MKALSHRNGFLEQSFDKIYIFCYKLEHVYFLWLGVCVCESGNREVTILTNEVPPLNLEIGPPYTVPQASSSANNDGR